MGKRIKVNWKDLYELSLNTNKNAEEFENIRGRIQAIVNSLNTDWQGIDHDNYVVSASKYLEALKKDTDYLYELSDYFNKSALKYNGGVEEGLTRVRNMEKNYIVMDNKVLSISEVEGNDFYGKQ